MSCAMLEFRIVPGLQIVLRNFLPSRNGGAKTPLLS